MEVGNDLIFSILTSQYTSQFPITKAICHCVTFDNVLKVTFNSDTLISLTFGGFIVQNVDFRTISLSKPYQNKFSVHLTSYNKLGYKA